MANQPAVPNLVIEFVEPEDVGFQTTEDGPSAPQLVLDILAAFARHTPRPADVNVVISAEFDTSVRERHNELGIASNYTSDRGAGMVSAKTIPMAEDRYDVLFPAFPFAEDLPVPEGFPTTVSRSSATS